jgi:hypothetical protein
MTTQNVSAAPPLARDTVWSVVRDSDSYTEVAACVVLADREFDEWAMAAWPPFCDAVLLEHAAATSAP